jgi:hypothetical protein
MRIQRALPLLTLILLIFPSISHANGDSLRLSASSSTVEVGQQVTVDVTVRGAPTIYGADVRLTFDPQVLEVVDADEATAGVQLQPGDFIDIDKSFVLQHGADNEAGTVDYALALLNPAPEVEGDGTLVQVTFRAKAEGETTISIEDGLYGTKTGETIAPELDSIDITVVAEGEAPGPIARLLERVTGGEDGSDTSGDETPSTPLIIVLAAVGVIGVGLLGYLLGRRNKQETKTET